MSNPSRIDLLGVGVDPLPRDELIPTIAGWIDNRQSRTVSYLNVHVLNQALTEPSLRSFLATADLVYCDGNGIRLGAHLLSHSIPDRMTGADWIWDLAAAAAGRWRIYWIGGKPGVTQEAATILQREHPQLVVGTDHGFHPRTGAEDAACINRINQFQPDIVLVGMGTPEQEKWVAERRAHLEAPVVWCLGATADFISGVVPRGPQWLTDRAEWLSRLVAQPSRLWRRYLFGNTLFLARVLRHRWS